MGLAVQMAVPGFVTIGRIKGQQRRLAALAVRVYSLRCGPRRQPHVFLPVGSRVHTSAGCARLSEYLPYDWVNGSAIAA